MVITAFNPLTDGLEKSYLASSTSAGATVLTVKNDDRFLANDKIMIGEMGREKTEIVTVSSLSGSTTLNIGATVFPHSADEPVYRLRYDQVKFYRSTTGVSGSYTLISTQTIDVDNANLTTIYDDTTGLAAYYYESSYYNSVAGIESALSDPVQGTGYPRGSVGALLDELFTAWSDENEEFASRDEVISWFNEVNDDLTLRRRRPYEFLLTRTTANRVAQNASGAGTYLDYPTDFWKLDRIDYVYNNTAVSPSTSTTYSIRYKDPEDFRNTYGDSLFSATSTSNSDVLQFFTIDEAVNKIRLWPYSSTSANTVFYIYYYKKFTELNSEADLFETPNPLPYKMYAMMRYFEKKAFSDFTQSNQASLYQSKYERAVAQLGHANSKDVGSPRSFKFNPQTYKGNRAY